MTRISFAPRRRATANASEKREYDRRTFTGRFPFLLLSLAMADILYR